MKKVKILSWTERIPSLNGESEEVKHYSTMDLIAILFRQIEPRHQPAGVEGFKLMKGLYDSIAKVEKKRNKGDKVEYFNIENDTYQWLNEHAFKHIPVRWAFNSDIAAAVDGLLNPEEVDANA